MHSPWGLIDQVCEKKGWTLKYVLEEISWLNLQMLAVDKVQFVKRSTLVIKVPKEDIKKHREQYNNGR